MSKIWHYYFVISYLIVDSFTQVSFRSSVTSGTVIISNLLFLYPHSSHFWRQILIRINKNRKLRLSHFEFWTELLTENCKSETAIYHTAKRLLIQRRLTTIFYIDSFPFWKATYYIYIFRWTEIKFKTIEKMAMRSVRYFFAPQIVILCIDCSLNFILAPRSKSYFSYLHHTQDPPL